MSSSEKDQERKRIRRGKEQGVSIHTLLFSVFLCMLLCLQLFTAVLSADQMAGFILLL